jgi:dienelactone hydrolase
MLKQLFTLLAISCTTIYAIGQTTKPERYRDLVFQNVSIERNMTYSPKDSASERKSHLFDLYQPKGDQAKLRPLIIWMHGGGFIFGNKEADGIELWSKTFAQRGYVCVAINYSLSKKNPLFHFDELKKSCFYAVQDAKTAVRYFKLHHSEYNIDPDKIILAGNSAGGLIALQAAYAKDADLAKMAELPDPNPQHHDVFKVAGVINFWGGIFDLNWLKNADVPIVSVLGANDKIVPPTHKNAALYGGEDIHTRADSLGIPNELKVFDGYAHELRKHFNPVIAAGKDTQKRWLEAGQFAADFLCRKVSKS